jgi:3-oxoacyl-[acyl-carrier-protein] synthase-1
VVLFNHSSSVCVDREYERTITIGDDYFPSPSLFVYTLPNMVCGETAIRHGYHAETSFYILSSKDETLMNEVIQSTFIDKTIQSMVAGWVDYQDEHTFEADIKLYEKVKK